MEQCTVKHDLSGYKHFMLLTNVHVNYVIIKLTNIPCFMVIIFTISRCCPSRLKDKLVLHIIVLCLILDEFDLPLDDLQRDLKLGQNRYCWLLWNRTGIADYLVKLLLLLPWTDKVISITFWQNRYCWLMCEAFTFITLDRTGIVDYLVTEQVLLITVWSFTIITLYRTGNVDYWVIEPVMLITVWNLLLLP